ncbi:hypothetical protein ECEC4196_0777, partial [Escherichia coli EC4196]|uniref:hypothetical protein n=1 Tax=Escherichia coli TaxID=562 RepID=UPI0002672654
LLSFEYIENRQRKRWRFFVSGRCSEEYLDTVIPIETYIHEIYKYFPNCFYLTDISLKAFL